MRSYFLLLFIFLSGAIHAQRYIGESDPDFDRAYCIHNLMYGYINGVEAPVHYSQFFSQYYRDNKNDVTLSNYFDSGYVIQYLVFGAPFGCWTTIEESKFSYSKDRKQIIAEIENGCVEPAVKSRKIFRYSPNNLIMSIEVFPNITKDTAYKINYKYDSSYRITHIYINSAKEQKLLHRYIYEEDNRDTLFSDWRKYQTINYECIKDEGYKLSRALKNICDPDIIGDMLSKQNMHIIKQFDSVDKSLNFIFFTPEIIYATISYSNPNIYVFQTNTEVDLYLFNSGQLATHKRCYFSFGSMTSYYRQAIMRKYRGRWKEKYAYDKKRLKKNRITNSIHILKPVTLHR